MSLALRNLCMHLIILADFVVASMYLVSSGCRKPCRCNFLNMVSLSSVVSAHSNRTWSTVSYAPHVQSAFSVMLNLWICFFKMCSGLILFLGLFRVQLAPLLRLVASTMASGLLQGWPVQISRRPSSFAICFVFSLSGSVCCCATQQRMGTRCC